MDQEAPHLDSILMSTTLMTQEVGSQAALIILLSYLILLSHINVFKMCIDISLYCETQSNINIEELISNYPLSSM